MSELYWAEPVRVNRREPMQLLALEGSQEPAVGCPRDWPDPPLDAALVAANSGQRVATAAVAVSLEGLAGQAALTGAFAGGLAVGLSSRVFRARSSACASATDGFVAEGADDAGGVFCGAACDSPLPSERRYQQLRLLAWSTR
jgi:hypothetical protein